MLNRRDVRRMTATGSGNGDGLVAVHAPSVAATMNLAEALIDLELPPIEPAARRLM